MKCPVPDSPLKVTSSSVNGDKTAPVDFRVYKSGIWSVVHLAGEVDMQRVPSLRALLEGEGPNVVFDLSGVTFMDCSGLGLLAATLGSGSRSDGQVRVAGASRQVRKLIVLGLLDGPLSMYGSLEAALTSPTPVEDTGR